MIEAKKNLMEASNLIAEECDLLASARTNAIAFEEMGHIFSADLARNFAAEIEAGMPASFYRHWINEQGARVQAIRGRDADMMRAKGMR
jgi:hypothetical protein